MREYKTQPLYSRLIKKVSMNPITHCWDFQGYKTPKGYGRLMVRSDTTGKITMDYAHRVSYKIFNGPIPKDKEMHHSCFNKGCCNPEHLHAVDRREHLVNLTPGSVGFVALRKRACPKGHPLSGDNLNPSALRHGYRKCATCKRNLEKDRRRRHKDTTCAPTAI